MRHVLVALVDFYRRFVSPLLPPMCRFTPSCSAYAREALLRHGALEGTLLAVWRVLRCNPFYRGPFHDPVPPARRRRRRGAAPEGAGEAGGGEARDADVSGARRAAPDATDEPDAPR